MKQPLKTAPARRPHGRSGGFTLIELMIAVVIVGILMSVVTPLYLENMRKTRRADAKDALFEVANRQEQFMLDNSTYTDDLRDLGLVDDDGDADDPYISADSHYQVVAAACAGGTLARCYTLTATPTSDSPQTKDSKCTSFVLGSDGSKTAGGSLGNECW